MSNDSNNRRKKECGCSSPERRKSESRENQFSPTFTTTRDQQKRGHLILNNFISSVKVAEKKSSDQQTENDPFNESRESETNHDSPQSNSHANFLYVYFHFSYYLGLTPFRLRKIRTSGHCDQQQAIFKIHEYLPQKILCGLSNILVLFAYAVEFRKCVQAVKRDNPISFFKLFEASSSLAVKAIILKCFWRNKVKFLDVVRYLNNPYLLGYNKFKLQSFVTIISLCSFYVVIGFARMLTGADFLHPSDLTPARWVRRLVAEARYAFFVGNVTRFDSASTPDEDIRPLDGFIGNVSHGDSTQIPEGISPLDGFLAVITGISYQCRFIAGFFVDVGILCCVLTLWAPVAGFAASIRKQVKMNKTVEHIFDNSHKQVSPHSPISQEMQLQQVEEEANRQELVTKQYRALKQLAELISRANGDTILPFISEAVFGYALFFEDVLITTNVFRRIVLLCFYFCAVNILVLSADVCRKMQSCMKTWLWDEDRFASIPIQKLQLILHDLSSNAVGITASGIFTIDFYLVGSMISVLITLFIIRLQYQNTDT